MRRVTLFFRLLAAFYFAFVPLAEAKIAVTFDRSYVSNTTTLFNAHNGERYGGDLIREALDRTCDWREVPATALVTEDPRTGIMVWNRGTAGAFTESFDGWVHVGFNGKMTTLFPNYRPDSLTLVYDATGDGKGDGPQIPQMMVFVQGGNYSGNVAQDSTADSTGTDVAFGFAQGNLAFAECFQAGYMRSTTLPTRPFLMSAFVSSVTANATPPAGGFRQILTLPVDHGLGEAWINSAVTSDRTQFIHPMWADSCAPAAPATDGIVIWDRPMSHMHGAKTIEFVQPFGTSSCAESTGTNKVPCEFDVQVFLTALAHFDSLTGGKVFDRSKIPVQILPVVRGAFTRSNFRNPGGMDPSDFSAVSASSDTVSKYGIPLLIAGDPDSARTYTAELAMWKRNAGARFTPYFRTGLDTTVIGYGGSWTYTHPRDVFGRFRNRAAYGDGTCVGADSSCFCGFKRGFALWDSIAPGRSSHFLIPPDDDWSPKNLSAGPTYDSLGYAAAAAGAIGIAFNSQVVPIRQANPVGYSGVTQRRLRTAAGSILLLGYSGYRIAGSSVVYDVRSDSAGAHAQAPCQQNQAGAGGEQYAYPNLLAYEVSRAVNSAIYATRRDFDFMPYRWTADAWDGVNTPRADGLYGLKRGNVFMMSVQDFGSGGFTPATRPAVWTLKSLDAFMRTCAKLSYGNTPIVVWAKPEEMKAQ